MFYFVRDSKYKDGEFPLFLVILLTLCWQRQCVQQLTFAVHVIISHAFFKIALINGSSKFKFGVQLICRKPNRI
jgi:hypothetical protein